MKKRARGASLSTSRAMSSMGGIIRKAREKAQRFAAIEGHGLGEADKAGELDTKSWLMGQKKRQKKIEKARKLEEELAAAEAAAAETATAETATAGTRLRPMPRRHDRTTQGREAWQLTCRQ